MDIANGREDCMSGCRSFGSNCRRLSQSRKISVGVLSTPVVNSQTKSVKETATAENQTYGNGYCVKDHKGSSPPVRKEVTLSPQDVSPWVSTRSLNTKVSSVAVHTPNFNSTKYLRPKLSKKVSVAHSVKYFGDKKTDMKSNEGKQTNHDATENVEPVANHEFSIEPEALQAKELGRDEQGRTETEGCGTLKMKLWEILGNVSSPSKQCPGSPPVELTQNPERERKDSPVEKANQKSDTIESDSQKPDHIVKKPLLRSSTRKNASSRKHNNDLEAKSTALHRKDFVQKDIFSFRGEQSGRLSDTANDVFLCQKRKNKTGKEVNGQEKIQPNVYGNAKKRRQSEDKTQLLSSSEKLNTEKDKVHSDDDRFVCYTRRSKREKAVSGQEKLQGQAFDIYDKKRQQSEDKTRSISSAEKLNTEPDKVHFAKSTRNKKSDVVTRRKVIGSKIKSVSSGEKSSVQRNKVHNANSTSNRRNDAFTKSKTGSKETNVRVGPLDQRAGQKRDVEILTAKKQQEDITNSLLKNRLCSVQDFASTKSPANSFAALAETQKGHLNHLSPVDNVAATDGVRSFKSLLKRDVEIPTAKDQQEDIANSLSKNRMGSVEITSPAKSPVNSFAVFAESKKGHLNNLDPVDSVAATDGVRSFKSLLNSNISECKLNAQDGGEPKYCPFTTSVFTMDDDKGKRLSKASSDTSDSESSEDETNIKEMKKGNLHDQRPFDNIAAKDSVRSFKSLMNSKPSECKSNVQDVGEELPLTMEEDRVKRFSESATDSESSKDTNIKGRREPEALSTENFVAEKLLCGPNKRLRNEKSVQMTECTPISGSSREIEDINEHQTYVEQYQEDGLAGAVALLAAALNRIKAKLKSVSTKKTAEILRASTEDICLQLQNAESQIKTDMGKLTSLTKVKRKRMETRFQEKQDQLLAIFKKFKEEVNQHLNYGRIFEELEEQEVELKGNIEKQRENHMNLIEQVEQAIKGQLDDTESRIVAVQDSAREKMLQMKLVVAECAKTCSAWLG